MSAVKRKFTAVAPFVDVSKGGEEDQAPEHPLQIPAPIYGSLRQFQRRQRQVRQLAQKAVFDRPYAMGSKKFSLESEDSFVYGRMSEKMAEVQRVWAKDVLVTAWLDPEIRCGDRLVVLSDEFLLALSWFSGIDVFHWPSVLVAEFYFHLCRLGGLKKYFTAAKPSFTKDKANFHQLMR